MFLFCAADLSLSRVWCWYVELVADSLSIQRKGLSHRVVKKTPPRTESGGRRTTGKSEPRKNNRHVAHCGLSLEKYIKGFRNKHTPLAERYKPEHASTTFIIHMMTIVNTLCH